MTSKVSRRQFLKRGFSVIFGAIASTTVGYFYARYIEPKQIQLSKHTIKHPLIPKEFHNIKIIQFSDTHVGHYFDLDQLETVVNKINGQTPDIVLFTGDLMDEPNKYRNIKKITPILSKIKAPLGKYAIYGNHDHGGYGTELYKNVMIQSEFKLLINESIEIVNNSEKITIGGLDDAMLGRPDFSKTFEKIRPSTFTILLAHEPDIALKSAKFGAHMQLSGHSHGGQIQIPLYGPLITPPLGKQYYEGKHLIGNENMMLFVNRGLGTTRLPLRFFSKPEISLFTLHSN